MGRRGHGRSGARGMIPDGVNLRKARLRLRVSVRNVFDHLGYLPKPLLVHPVANAPFNC